MIAHGLRYVAQARRTTRATWCARRQGPGHRRPDVPQRHRPCPRGWRSDGAQSIELAPRSGQHLLLATVRSRRRPVQAHLPPGEQPLVPGSKSKGRFSHLFKGSRRGAARTAPGRVDFEWDKLLRKCASPSRPSGRSKQQAACCGAGQTSKQAAQAAQARRGDVRARLAAATSRTRRATRRGRARKGPAPPRRLAGT